MPSATTARRGPPVVENGEAARYGATTTTTASNPSNGRVPVQPPNHRNGNNNNIIINNNGHHPNNRELQRHPPQPVGTNRAVETDGGSDRLPPPIHGNKNDVAVSQQPTPLFERLVTEEVQELRAYVRMVEHQNRRLIELERVHGDLEVRLEVEFRGRQQLEATLEAREREWTERWQQIERDRDHWKALVEAEKIKNSKLLDQVYRKDQDIHRMLQRKYDNENVTRSTRNARSNTTTEQPQQQQPQRDGNQSRSGAGGGIVVSSASSQYKTAPPGTTTNTTVGTDVQRPPNESVSIHKGPLDYLFAAGSAEKVRTRNAKSLLMDMFGM